MNYDTMKFAHLREVIVLRIKISLELVNFEMLIDKEENWIYSTTIILIMTLEYNEICSSWNIYRIDGRSLGARDKRKLNMIVKDVNYGWRMWYNPVISAKRCLSRIKISVESVEF